MAHKLYVLSNETTVELRSLDDGRVSSREYAPPAAGHHPGLKLPVAPALVHDDFASAVAYVQATYAELLKEAADA